MKNISIRALRVFVGRFVAGSCVAVSLFASLDANAADLSKKIPSGGSIGEVLNTWGEPSEKVEEEVKREVIWYYQEGARVTFKDGRVSSWRAPASVRQKEAEIAAAKALATPVGGELTAETRDLVRDIAREVPSGPDVPYVEAPQAGGVTQSHAGTNPGNRGPQAGISPADVEIDDE